MISSNYSLVRDGFLLLRLVLRMKSKLRFSSHNIEETRLLQETTGTYAETLKMLFVMKWYATVGVRS